MSVHFDHETMAQLLAAALEALSLPVLLHDEDAILFANGAARTLLGAGTRAQIEGVRLDEFVAPELADMIGERRGYLLANRVVFNDLPIKMHTLDGRTIHLKVDARPLTVNDVTIGMVTLAGRMDALA